MSFMLINMCIHKNGLHSIYCLLINMKPTRLNLFQSLKKLPTKYFIGNKILDTLVSMLRYYVLIFLYQKNPYDSQKQTKNSFTTNRHLILNKTE